MAEVGGGTAAERHFAQRYRQQQAQLDRSIEERDILASEVTRTFNWLEEREAAIKARLAELQTSVAEGAATGSGWDKTRDQLLATGKAAMLTVQLMRLRRMHADARVRLAMA